MRPDIEAIEERAKNWPNLKDTGDMRWGLELMAKDSTALIEYTKELEAERDHLLKAEDTATAMLHTHECPPCDHAPPEDLAAAAVPHLKETARGTVADYSVAKMRNAIKAHRCVCQNCGPTED